MSKINVGIIGFGTVGSGTFEILTKNTKIIRNRVGADIVVKKIADLDIESDRGVKVERDLFTTDAYELINDPEIDIIVELIGGLTKAKEFILSAIKNGKHVITANKALLAEQGREIYEAAEQCGVILGFEASVAGGIPIINALRHGLSANNIQKAMGILNGTSNYILTRMTQEGLPYNKVVQDAVKLGYAEDPPTLDVDGTDAAHKLTILISIMSGEPASFASIYKEGITDLTPDDILFATEFGYRVKMLAIIRNLGNRIEARVHPTMIPKDHILANVNEAYNAIYFEGDFVGPCLFYGLGAGRRPTGSAIVSDIMDIARQIKLGIKGLMPPLAHAGISGSRIEIMPMEKLTCAYYFRFSALDSPGVLSRIAGILGENRISIASVIQKGRKINGSVPIVMLTHKAQESDVQKAIRQLNDLDVLTSNTVLIRVEDRQ
ncbi:Homoserine dehydrogenase [uncultured Desulfobacterium sp.]|uniref:Homoserine dehydrogenase n=1 Tax=uncultured Desulfobacterium sp. TaxID=201089 RepID=A0A445N0B1_9BACT|nr:Homoserine dehydrogenase [uncultured Desulfobacterium sp.]